MPSSYALRPVTSAETAFNKLTVSCWLKGHADGTQRSFWGIFDQTSSNRFFHLYYSSNGSLYGYWKQNEGTFFTLGTTQKFRDPNAWFHFQMTMDTTLATASDRVKFYMNGERITSFEDSLDTASPFTQNATCNILSNTDGRMIWGAGKQSGTLYYWDRYMSHCHMCVGYAYDPTEFGSTDSVTGEWKIKVNPNVSYGTNGGWWFKDGSQLTDSSTNSNTLTTVGGTLTNTEDNPSNVFATFNPLFRHGQTTSGSSDFFENGNTTFYTPSNNDARKGFFVSSLGMSSGKYYCEMKVRTGGRLFVGICNANVLDSTSVPYDVTNQSFLGYYPADGTIKYDGDSTYSTSVTASDGDILGFALDCDNKHWYIHKNGTYFNSGDPTSGSTGTGSIIGNVTSGSSYFNHGEMFFFAGDFSTTGYARVEYNFGNGYFGTTAISSEGTNASGIGKFEYDVPNGNGNTYTALSTKGLNE